MSSTVRSAEPAAFRNVNTGAHAPGSVGGVGAIAVLLILIVLDCETVAAI